MNRRGVRGEWGGEGLRGREEGWQWQGMGYVDR
jgi:hypothetical protein